MDDEMSNPPDPQPGDPQPGDPPYLFCFLFAARKGGDRRLETLARDWLAAAGIKVTFDPRRWPKAPPAGSASPRPQLKLHTV